MKILLINTNPVVSRLMALCTRSDAYHLEEVSSAAQVREENYDLVFVDDASYTVVTEGAVNGLDVKRKVFFSSQLQEIPGFDMVIKKPFLPSQIIEILEADLQDSEERKEIPEERLYQGVTEEKDPINLTFEEMTADNLEEAVEENPSIFPLTAEEPIANEEPAEEYSAVLEADEEEGTSESEAVLDSGEIEKIKALLEMDEEEEISAEALSEEEYEARKVEAIKEELIAQGLEIVEESRMVEEFGLDESILSRPQKGKKKQKLTLHELEKLEMMFAYTIRNMKPKKLRKLLKGEKTKLKLKDNR